MFIHFSLGWILAVSRKFFLQNSRVHNVYSLYIERVKISTFDAVFKELPRQSSTETCDIFLDIWAISSRHESIVRSWILGVPEVIDDAPFITWNRIFLHAISQLCHLHTPRSHNRRERFIRSIGKLIVVLFLCWRMLSGIRLINRCTGCIDIFMFIPVKTRSSSCSTHARLFRKKRNSILFIADNSLRINPLGDFLFGNFCVFPFFLNFISQPNYSGRMRSRYRCSA